jgi:hypothetical protein
MHLDTESSPQEDGMNQSQPQSVEFFWMVTFQKPMARGMAIQTSYGTTPWSGPATRYALLNWFMTEYVPDQLPDMQGASILHWQCEPNDYRETGRPGLRVVPYTSSAPDAG